MKKILSLVLAAVLLFALIIPVAAYSEKQLDTADALYGLGLFLGYGKSYGLDNGLTRNEGIVLLVRMLGKEDAAKAENNTTPFTDVADFAEPHVGYAYKNGLVKGYSEKKFGGDDKLSDKQFCTLVLRALGYSDSGDGADFTYDGARDYAAKLGLVASADENKNFTRGNVVEIFWNALNKRMKTGGYTLAEYLTNEGVFTPNDWLTALDTQKNGRRENAESGEKTEPQPEKWEETTDTAKTCAHTHIKTEIITESTCTVKGKIRYICEDCGATSDGLLPLKAHTPVADGVAKNATCAEAGSMPGYKCAVCGAVISVQETVPALGHAYILGYCIRCGAEGTGGESDINGHAPIELPEIDLD